MKRLLAALLLLSAAFRLTAQNRQQPTDSLVRLMSAQSAELIQENNRNYRKVIGPARFLHNKTYLICDTAYWDVDIHIIQAYGHVRILQDETVLTSEKLDYYIDEDLAQFRGTLVQLQDKDRNTLRTRYLDYNTKDSVAIFKRGGAMRDKDGQLIESNNGSYDSKTKIFRFDGNVNMFTDSVFVRTEDLTYYGNTGLAQFDYGVDIWRNADMLSARRGEYDRHAEVFHFFDDVHGMTKTQEGWADTLHFNKLTQDFELHGNVQVTDDERKVSGFGEHIWYVDSLERITMTVDATIIAEVEDAGNKVKPRDTLYMAADRIIRNSIARCDITEGQLKDSERRKADLAIDPVSEYRKKAGEEAKKKAEEQERELAKAQGKKFNEPKPSDSPKPDDKKQKPGEDKPAQDPDPALSSPDAPADSTSSQPPKDTTRLSFIKAVGKVRVFKSDMQARCDSLLYSDLDSLAMLYLDPIVWNEGNRQYVSDSITVVVQNQKMRKASLQSNAFITIQEDSVSFDQIRGTEMMAYFDTATVLERFDALGGASAVFFLEENDALATVNKVESKMLSAYFDKGEIQRIYYFDNPHNDAYPTVQLPNDDRQMKGFRWNPDLRPQGGYDITPYVPRGSERLTYEAKPQAKFPQTEIYFPGYMKEVYAGLAARDSAQRASRRMRDSLQLDKPRVVTPSDSTLLDTPPSDTVAEVTPDAGETEPAETPAEAGAAPGEPETPAVPGTPETPVVPGKSETAESPEGPGEAPEIEAKPEEIPPALDPHVADSIARVRAARDSILAIQRAERAARDSIRAVQDSIKAVKNAIAAQKKAARDSVQKIRNDKREARWAELDARDAARDSVKQAKKQAKYRKVVARKLEIRDKEAARERSRMDKYIRHYEQVKAKRDAYEAAHPERARKKAEAAAKKAAKDRMLAEKRAAKEQAEAMKKEERARIAREKQAEKDKVAEEKRVAKEKAAAEKLSTKRKK